MKKSIKNTNKEILASYLPAETVDMIDAKIQQHKVNFVIKGSRSTKSGDYRHPHGANGQHKITVNNNLNKYAFLLVTLHEFAHLHVWEQYKRRVSPHGTEWKKCFAALLAEYMDKNVFPPNIHIALNAHLKKLPARTFSDTCLAKALHKYDNDKGAVADSTLLFVSDLPDNTVFRAPNGMVFQKIVKVRTRYKCKLLSTNRLYLVPGSMPIEKVEN